MQESLDAHKLNLGLLEMIAGSKPDRAQMAGMDAAKLKITDLQSTIAERRAEDEEIAPKAEAAGLGPEDAPADAPKATVRSHRRKAR